MVWLILDTDASYDTLKGKKIELVDILKWDDSIFKKFTFLAFLENGEHLKTFRGSRVNASLLRWKMGRPGLSSPEPLYPLSSPYSCLSLRYLMQPVGSQLFLEG